jgi:sigma-B regulation protein RsbU (phosphoserine phosphatase)
MKDSKIRILITDDSPEWREYLQKLFTDQVYELELAEDGYESVRKYRSFEPQILLLDLNLPGFSGLEVIKQIRNKARDHDLYIITLTSRDDTELKNRALNLGANDYLLKPFGREDLHARVNVAKRHLRLNRQLRLAYQQISQEIDNVAYLQKKLLPRDCVWKSDISVQCIYHPSGRASGDYYDYFPLNDHTLRLVIADVSGSGGRAAFLMGIVRALVRSTESYYLNLVETINLVNKQFLEIIGQEVDFVTLFAADVDTRNKTLTYINAGHCPGILCRSDRKIELLQPTTTVLGFFELGLFPRILDISDKWGLLLFTDGYYEWELSPHKIFGLDNFLELASDLVCERHFNLNDLEAKLTENLKGKPVFRDDRSGLLICWKPVVTKVFRRQARSAECRQLTQQVHSVLQSELRDQELVYDLKLATAEACSNVCLYAYAGMEPGEVEVQVRIDPRRQVKIEVRDWGRPFTGPPEDAFVINPEDESGRGIYLISQLVDDYTYQHTGGTNVLTLTRHLRGEGEGGFQA